MAPALYRENVVKVWANVSAVPALNDSFNMTSVADGGTGIITITLDRDFANSTYAIVGSLTDSSNGSCNFGSLAVGSVIGRTSDAAGTSVDAPFTFMAVGDQ